MAKSNSKQESIKQFKEFVKRHPKLVQEVRGGKKTWQDLFEEWYLLGEEDPVWEQYGDGQQSSSKEEEKSGAKAEFIPVVLQTLKNMDMNKVQYHLTNVNSAIGNIQQLLQQFIPSNRQSNSSSQGSKNPFTFRKD